MLSRWHFGSIEPVRPHRTCAGQVIFPWATPLLVCHRSRVSSLSTIVNSAVVCQTTEMHGGRPLAVTPAAFAAQPRHVRLTRLEGG